mgnify:CR=1 FL=1
MENNEYLVYGYLGSEDNKWRSKNGNILKNEDLKHRISEEIGVFKCSKIDNLIFSKLEGSEYYLNKYDEDKQFAEHCLKKDKTYFLEIKVIEPALTTFLMKWLYYNTNNKRLILFGCELNIIHFSRESVFKPFKDKLLDLINNFKIEE